MRTLLDAEEVEAQEDVKVFTKQRSKGKTKLEMRFCSPAPSVPSCPSQSKGQKNKDVPGNEDDMAWEWEAPKA